MNVNRQDDQEFEKALRDSLHARADQLFTQEPFQERVLAEIRRRQQTNSARSVWSRFRSVDINRRTLWVAMGSGIAAVMVAFVVFAQSHGALQNQFHGLDKMSAQGLSAAQPHESALQTLNATLAPISSQDVAVAAQSAQSANAAGHTSSVDGPFTAAGSGKAGAASATKSAGAPAGSAPKAGQAGGKGNVHGFVALTPNVLTFRARLYNTSASPVQGRALQGMLFVLRSASGLAPMQSSDWEYFVNGPNAVIPAHGSVQWSFTLNPTPAYAHLNSRYIHLIWMMRTPNSSLPSLSMGTLPVHVSRIHVRVTGTAGAGIQFLTITARVRNEGAQPWFPRTALGMLFFERYSGAQLLGRGTYKYFDDVAVLSGPTQKLGPGQSATVEFQITGVPNTNMRKLPLRILLIARSQVGV
ncbi:MAG: hypothetical protein ACYCYO_00680 [Bacilli bacterium]